MTLLELFDRVANFQLTADNEGYFNISGKTYVVDFYPVGDTVDTIEVSFGLRKGVTQGVPDYAWGVEGSGDEIMVFSTVIAIIRKFMNKNPSLKNLVFSAKLSEPSRVKLYNRMARTVMPGWEVTLQQVKDDMFYTVTNPNVKAVQGAKFNPEDIPF